MNETQWVLMSRDAFAFRAAMEHQEFVFRRVLQVRRNHVARLAIEGTAEAIENKIKALPGSP